MKKYAAILIWLFMSVPTHADAMLLQCATDNIYDWDSGKMEVRKTTPFGLEAFEQFVFDSGSGQLWDVSADGALQTMPNQFEILQEGDLTAWDVWAVNQSAQSTLRIRAWKEPMGFVLFDNFGYYRTGTCERSTLRVR